MELDKLSPEKIKPEQRETRPEKPDFEIEAPSSSQQPVPESPLWPLRPRTETPSQESAPKPTLDQRRPAKDQSIDTALQDFDHTFDDDPGQAAKTLTDFLNQKT